MATAELIPLILAGDLEKVKALFEEKGDLVDLKADDAEYKDENGAEKKLDKPIIVAAMETGNLELVKFLLDKGADVNTYWLGLDPPGPIFFATECNHPKIREDIAIAVLHHADISLQNAKGQTILFEAQLRSAEHAKEILTKFGVNVAARDNIGHTVVDEILFHDRYHLMPLYQEYIVGLIKNNDVDTLKNLVFDGFEYVLKGQGVNAHDLAVESEANDVAEFIQKVPTIMETIPVIHSAIGANNLSGVKDLLDKDYAVAKDTGGRCVLHLAIMCDMVDAVKYIVQEYPETLRVKDNMGRTPLHYAAASQSPDLYDILVKAGASEDVRGYKNLTPKDYKQEMVSPGISGQEGLNIEGMLEAERTAKYGQKIYLKLQYKQLKQAMDNKDVEAAKAVLDNLAFDVDAFYEEGIIPKPLLFLCIEAGAEQSALYLIKKGANIRDCVDKDAAGGKLTIQDAAFKAQMGELYQYLADQLGFRARRLSAFSETSSMMTEKVDAPMRPAVVERKPPAGLEDFDSKYLGTVLGEALTVGLSEVAQKRPWDPIEYLAQWLYKHNMNVKEQEKREAEKHQILIEKSEADRDEIRKRRHKKEAKHLQKLDAKRQEKLEAEEKERAEEERKAKELEEIRKKQKEADQVGQPPELDTVAEEENEPPAAPSQGGMSATVTEEGGASEEGGANNGEEGEEHVEGRAEEEQVAEGDGGGEAANED